VTRKIRARSTDPDIAEIAATIGDPVRAAILLALMDGDELPASELAYRAGASAQAASAHLARLVDRGLLQTRAAGRQRLFRVASAQVAHAIEALGSIAKPVPIVSLSQSESMQRLRQARSCYDHLAGRLGVQITERFVERRMLRASQSAFELTRHGERFFVELGIDVDAIRNSRRAFARACTDWTERRPHLAGSLGASFLSFLIASKWVARHEGNRYLTLTEHGRSQLASRLKLSC
jgi:DNA-binding transcriptional ArsR family regulator